MKCLRARLRPTVFSRHALLPRPSSKLKTLPPARQAHQQQWFFFYPAQTTPGSLLNIEEGGLGGNSCLRADHTRACHIQNWCCSLVLFLSRHGPRLTFMSSLTSCEKTNRRPAYFYIIYGRGTGGHRPKPRSNFPEMELHCLNVAKPITPLLRSTPLLRYFATSWRCRFSQESTGVEGRRLRLRLRFP